VLVHAYFVTICLVTLPLALVPLSLIHNVRTACLSVAVIVALHFNAGIDELRENIVDSLTG
jgi:hypothetical protein